MKLALTCARYHPQIGGVETHVRELSERLVKKGFEIDVLTTDYTGKLPREDIINEVRVRRFKSMAPGEAYYFSRGLQRYLKENSDRFDIVHAHSYHAFPSLYAAQAKGRNRLVFTPHYHGTGHTLLRALLLRPYKFMGKRIFEKADRIICVSQVERELILSHFDVAERKIVVIPNGVNMKEFVGLERRSKIHKIILSVGRLEKYKGMQYLIESLPKLDGDITLEIVGKGPYKETLIRLVRKLDVEERVRFYQDLPRKELLQKYADADLFVLLSEREAFGISVAEALASKTPCILANTSALSEWVDGESCFGIDVPVEVDTLISRIKQVIGKSVHRSRLWDCEEVAEKTAELYDEIS